MELKNVNHIIALNRKNDFTTRFIEFIGTNIFIKILVLFFLLWTGGNVVLDITAHKAFDPYPFLAISTAINIYSAFTSSFLLKADKAKQERDELKHDHEFEVNKKILADTELIVKLIKASHAELKKEINKNV